MMSASLRRIVMATLAAAYLRWHPEASPSIYTTPAGHERHLCGRCATPLFNLARGIGLGCVILASLFDAAAVEPWAHVNTEAPGAWTVFDDVLPRFAAWPSRVELVAMADVRGVALPPMLLPALG